MDERPKVGIRVYIIKDGKVLFGKRKSKHGEGRWCPPGGHLEFSEEPEECAKREAMEEAGISIKNIRFITATNDIHKSEGKHYVTLHVVCDYDSGEVRVMEPEKCERWDWFKWEELPEPLFLSNENLVKKGINPITYQ